MKKMSKHIKYNASDIIKIAKSTLLNGGLIVYPTDTLYGFGVDARNGSSIEKLNKIKGRTSPTSVIAPNIEAVFLWTDISPNDWLLVKKKLIEQTTVIVPVKKGIVYHGILGDDKTLGIRIPSHPFNIDSSQSIKFPVTTTSVNRHGEPPLNDPLKIKNEFYNDYDLFVDDGKLPFSKGSTIYKLINSRLIKIR